MRSITVMLYTTNAVAKHATGHLGEKLTDDDDFEVKRRKSVPNMGINHCEKAECMLKTR